jgi:hypothetical protein
MITSEYILGAFIVLLAVVIGVAVRSDIRRRRRLKKDRDWSRMQDQ